MSTKEWVYGPEQGAGLYQAINSDDKRNPAILEIEKPTNFTVHREEVANDNARYILRVEIDPEQFDAMAIAWCRKRKLHIGL
jgi:hypothetical protein